MNRRGAFVWLLVVVVIGGAVVAARVLGSDDSARTPDERSTRIVMFGNSLTAQGDWPELFPDREIVGAGFSGYTSEQLALLARDVVRSQPAAVFVLAGTNDVYQGQPPAWTANQLGSLIDAIEDESPDTRIVLQTIPPSAAVSAEVIATNEAIRRLAAARGSSCSISTPRSTTVSGGCVRPRPTTESTSPTRDTTGGPPCCVLVSSSSMSTGRGESRRHDVLLVCCYRTCA